VEADVGLVDQVKLIVGVGQRPVDAQRLAKAKPMRNPLVEWAENEDGSTTLKAPIEVAASGLKGFMAKKLQLAEHKMFELEPIGGTVWACCDGQHTFEAISRKLRDRYKMNRVEADASLAAFLQMLSQRRLISMMMSKP
jgi:Coenzyme PQQ synthesis protein D (PqqD)